MPDVKKYKQGLLLAIEFSDLFKYEPVMVHYLLLEAHPVRTHFEHFNLVSEFFVHNISSKKAQVESVFF